MSSACDLPSLRPVVIYIYFVAACGLLGPRPTLLEPGRALEMGSQKKWGPQPPFGLSVFDHLKNQRVGCRQIMAANVPFI